MPEEGVSDRLTGKNFLGRSTGDEPEQAILALLRISFPESDDPDLYRRRLQLVEQFAHVDLSRAAVLRSRLVKWRADDELSRLFQKLSTATRHQILGILQKKTEKHRHTESDALDTEYQKLGRTAMSLKDPRTDSRYIDNLVRNISINTIANTVELGWKENGKHHWIIVDLKDWYGKGVSTFVFQDKVFPNRSAADAKVQAFLSAARAQAQDRGIVHAYYKGSRNTILPTSFFRNSAPKIFAHFSSQNIDIDKLKAASGPQYVIEMLQSIFDSANPYPGLSVDEHGNINMDLDLDSLAGLAVGRLSKSKGIGTKKSRGSGGRLVGSTGRTVWGTYNSKIYHETDSTHFKQMSDEGFPTGKGRLMTAGEADAAGYRPADTRSSLNAARHGTAQHQMVTNALRPYEKELFSENWRLEAVERTVGGKKRVDELWVNDVKKRVFVADTYTGKVEPPSHYRKGWAYSKEPEISAYLDKGYTYDYSVAIKHPELAH